jgi:hypothetical protein
VGVSPEAQYERVTLMMTDEALRAAAAASLRLEVSMTDAINRACVIYGAALEAEPGETVVDRLAGMVLARGA